MSISENCFREEAFGTWASELSCRARDIAKSKNNFIDSLCCYVND